MTTTAMGLKLPSEDDFYNIGDFNGNFNRIEEVIGVVNDGLDSAAQSINAVDQRVTAANESIGAVDQRVTVTDNRITAINSNLTNAISAVGAGDSDAVHRLEGAVDWLEARIQIALPLLEGLVYAGQWRANCATASGTQLKAVTINGFPGYVDGVVIGIQFTNINTHAEPNLNINGGAGLLGNRQMWNEKGRIGEGNQVLATGRQHIFRFNLELNRWIWIMSTAV
ncbi:MAG: hypothetical protein FWH07_03265 [Oscillospiraceae bacterium]|nr:hypothetical protein [Oscillospiraceae bacterium]